MNLCGLVGEGRQKMGDEQETGLIRGAVPFPDEISAWR